jgi:hypothetical protein
MTKIVSLGALVLGLCTAAVVLAFTWNGESSATAKQHFCDSLSNLSSTVMSYQGLDPLNATNDELDSAADDISSAYDDVVDSVNGSLTVQLPLRELDYTVAVPVTIYIRVTARGDEEAAEEAGEIANQIESRVDSMDGVCDSHFGSTYDYAVDRDV